MKRIDWKPIALAFAIWASTSVAAQAQCTAPNLTVNDATCQQGEDCVVSIDLAIGAKTCSGLGTSCTSDADCQTCSIAGTACVDSGDCPGGETCESVETCEPEFAAAGATLSSNGSIACSDCAPGNAAGGVCNLNPTTCAWNVTDFSLAPFSDGEVATVTLQCDTLGTGFSLDLSDASLGKTDGTPQDSCGISGTLDCVECLSDADCSNGVFCDGAEVCNAGTCEAGTAPNCDDGVSCTNDTCNQGTDSCDNTPNDGLCDNGLFCDGAETCSAVSDCQAGTAPDCDDGVGCTDDSCNEGTNSCDNTPNDGLCDNGLFCDGAETCSAVSDCQAGTAPDCDDGVGCTDDSCNEGTDSCDNTPNDGLCDNGLFCDGAETCDAVSDCQAGTAPDCDDGVGCTDDSCNEGTDSCDNVANDANCDNGLFCDGTETCDAVSDCQGGTAPDCDDGVGCTDDTCNEGTDSCDNVANDANCDNGLFCDGTETCDAVSDCQTGTAPDCDDGVGCTDDTCNEGTDSCDNVVNDANCADAEFCNGAETCDAALDCQTGSDPCPGQTCDETGDSCFTCTVDADCNDGWACTDDVCNSGVCSNAENCALFEGCNLSGVCAAIAGDPDVDGLSNGNDPCPNDPRNLCYGDVAVDDTSGNDIRLNADMTGGAAECSGTKVDCNGDTWLADFGFSPPETINLPCNLNGGGEACVISGISTIFGCDDETTEDLFQCDRFDLPAAPELVYSFDVPNGQYLVNLLFANTFDGTAMIGDRVFDVAIEGAIPAQLDDFDQVAAAGGSGIAVVRSVIVEVSDDNGLQIEFQHDVTENPALKALEVLQAPDCRVDADCDNGLYCDGAEACNAGTCEAGPTPNCDDGVSCTNDSCNEGTDSCDNAPNDGLCDNGLFCDGSETCSATLDCQAGTPPGTDDGVACTDDSCDEAGDVIVNAPNDANCDNGLFCDGAETCNATLDCQAGTPPGTDDGVACTDDSCDEAGDVIVNAPNDANCDNGLFCDGAETCSAALGCQAGTPPTADDGVACTDDSCDEAGDVIVNAPNDANCDNGLFCDGAETCSAALGCQAGTPPTADDGVACTDDSCDEAGDVIVNAPNDANCDNGQFCDGSETCSATLDCQAGTPPTANDGVACTDDSCDEAGDVIVNTPNDANCDNGQFCDGAETCNATLDCQAGTPPTANDGVACTDDSCDEAGDVIVNAPNDGNCDNGQFCDGAETCSATLDCQAGTPPTANDGVACTDDSCDEAGDVIVNAPNDANCDNGLFCDGAETCDGALGCQTGTPPAADDGIVCTVDSCDEANNLIVNAPNDASCDDGMFCNGAETCDATLDCQAGSAPNCVDSVGCTADSCNETTDSCDNTPQNSACDNGTFCDGVEICDVINDCQVGTDPCPGSLCDEGLDRCADCLSDANCDNGVFCDGVETCDVDAICQPGSPVNCDDGIGCTVDACNEATDQCDNTANDASCSDGAFCNGTETCDATNDCQAGTPPGTDDGVACTDDSCDEINDLIVNAPNDANCDNGLFCDGAETCDAINDCQAGSAPVCDDGVDCTDDACNEATDGCDNITNDASCDDGEFCNGPEACDSLADCLAGSPPACDDGVNCTTDSCNEATDACESTADDASCDDGEFCNGSETCDPLSDCQAGATPDCSDGVDCTVDACNETTDACDHTSDDTACDNGEFCDGAETCDLVLDCVSGSSPCSDGVSCTIDACDDATDECSYAPSDAQCDDGLSCNGAETCDPISGCLSDAPLDCSDLDGECVFGVCSDEDGGCQQLPLENGTSCEDGNACTLEEPCLDGACPRVSFCGVPVSRAEKPVVSDALFTLRTSVGLELCSACECDVNADGSTSVTDALTILNATVDLPVDLACFEPVDVALIEEADTAINGD